MIINIKLSLNEELSMLIKKLSEQLECISQKDIIKTSELIEALNGFSKDINTILNKTEIISEGE